MQRYLQPVDDGLLMRTSGEWASVKLDYLTRYINTFETAMRDKWPVRNYIDLLAGPGKNRIRTSKRILLGSPLLALTAVFPFTGYYFIDLSSESTEALRQRCQFSPLYNRVDIRTGNCNELVGEIVASLKRDENRSLNLAFLDPEGLELEWRTVARLATIKRMDLIIYYPHMGITRYMRKAFETDGETAIDLFFGDYDWRNIYRNWLSNRVGPGVHRSLIDHYRRKLQGLGYKEVLIADEIWEEPLIRNIKKNTPLYRLIFASKHPLGHNFWKEITKRDVYGQRRLPL